MSSMSYCVIENTTSDLYTFQRVINDLTIDREPINEYEREHLKEAIDMMQSIIKAYKAGIMHGIIDENGNILERVNY